MSNEVLPPPLLARQLADVLRAARIDVVRRWLDRIVARVTVEPMRIFPTEALLDHVPLLVDGIADALACEAGNLEGKDAVEAKAMELGALRHEQGFDAYQILKEHEILGGIIYTTMSEALGRMDASEATLSD